MADRKPHRISLTDDDIELIVAALTARLAMARGPRAHRIKRLSARLSEGGAGNPKFRLGADAQEHE